MPCPTSKNSDAAPVGTGIGLALTKSIVDCHHGRIWVESVRENGSVFTVALLREADEFRNDPMVRFVTAAEKPSVVPGCCWPVPIT